jgi:tetratricopeptide (TPR) repeat protein
MQRWIPGLLLALALVHAEAAPLRWGVIVAVPPELRQRLDAQVLQKATVPAQRLSLLVDFMFDPAGLALEYDSRTTGTVEETFRSGKGNCLAFTLTFIALAKEAGLDPHAQELDHAVAQFHSDDMVFRFGHVNVVVKVQGRRHTVDFDREVRRLAAGPPKRVSDRRLAAHFHNNRGAELLALDDLAGAAAHFDAAIDADSTFVPALGNRGVLHSRRGDLRAAEASYLAALRHDGRHTPTLSNLVALLERSGQGDRVDRMQRRLDEVRRGDPVYNYALGMRQEQAGNFPAALAAYQRAASLQRNEPRFQLAVARAHLQAGNRNAAERALGRAAALSQGPARNALQAKLQQLRQ